MTRRAAPARQRLLQLVCGALAAYLLLSVGSPECRAELLFVNDGGIDDAAGCSSEDCVGTQTFELGTLPFAAISGTVDIDTVAETMDFTLSLASATLVENVTGTEDNGVAEVEFSDVTYSATGLAINEGLPGSFTIDFGATAMVDGDQTQRNDVGGTVNGTPAGFTRASALVTGNCFVVTPGDATCSFSFGTPGFALDVGDPTPAPRYFRHTMSLVLADAPPAVPSVSMPGLIVALLVATGVGDLLRRQRHGAARG